MEKMTTRVEAVKYNIYLIYKTLKLWLVNVSVAVKRVVKALVRRVSNYYSVKFKISLL